MKKIALTSVVFFFALAILFGGALSANLSKKIFDGPAKFSWDKKVHDFGKIKQGTPVTTEFKFTNTGGLPLQITDAKGSCGCTVPEWPKNAIAPGKTGIIKATFSAASVGQFNKTITITANTEGGMETLTIKGEVLAGATAN